MFQILEKRTLIIFNLSLYRSPIVKPPLSRRVSTISRVSMANSSPRDTPGSNRMSLSHQSPISVMRMDDGSPFGSAAKPPVYTPHKSVSSTPHKSHSSTPHKVSVQKESTLIQQKVSAPPSTQKIVTPVPNVSPSAQTVSSTPIQHKNSAPPSTQKPASTPISNQVSAPPSTQKVSSTLSSAQKPSSATTTNFGTIQNTQSPNPVAFTSSVPRNAGLTASPLVAAAPILVHKSPFASTAEQTISKPPPTPSKNALVDSGAASPIRVSLSAVNPGVAPQPGVVKEGASNNPSPAVSKAPTTISKSPLISGHKVSTLNDVVMTVRVLRSSSRSSSARTTPGMFFCVLFLTQF